MWGSPCLSILLLAVGPTGTPSGSREAAWDAVSIAIHESLPQTAISALEPILAAALQEKAYAEAVRALGLRVVLQAQIEGDEPEERILRLQAELETCPDPMRPAMAAILAHFYWRYFEEDRGRFQQRTATSTPSGPDLRTWDLPRILSEVDRWFTVALSEPTSLRETPVEAWDDLLVAGTVPDIYRPTLYDFLAHEALKFYVAGESVRADSEDEFEIAASAPIFAPAAEFQAWIPDTTDEGSLLLKAVHLYQRLLALHADDAVKSAFLDVDLGRLRLGYNTAVGEAKDSLYVDALQRFTQRWPRHELLAQALADWAEVRRRQGDLAEAHRLAQRGWQAFPSSAGGAMCFNMLQGIEAKSLSLQTEFVWNGPLPDIEITYRNITNVYFRIIPADFRARLEVAEHDPYHLSPAERIALLRRAPTLEWSIGVPPTFDYLERKEKLPAPRGLARGFYYILASADSSFGETDNVVSSARVWLSDLALVVREREGSLDGYVLDAGSGKPLRGAIVEAWRIPSWSRSRAAGLRHGPVATTNATGHFQLQMGSGQAAIVLARHRGDEIATCRLNRVFGDRSESARTRTYFFTDRSLYRPGQTIRYKGIHCYFDKEARQERPLAGRQIVVTLTGTNGQEVARAQHRANGYGSFSGEFMAPRGGLLGSMRIHAPDGGTMIHVEEYKRPKFFVELAPPRQATRLDSEVVVPGKATAYTGAGIGGALVRWRVVRSMQRPPRHFRRGGIALGGGRPIAHGTVVAGADGAFELRFKARPDHSVSPRDEPVFLYHVYADMTDATGETRSAASVVSVGYTALKASLSAEEWQTEDQPVNLTLWTGSLDAKPQAARGTVSIHRLEQPARVARAWQASDGPWRWAPRPVERHSAPDAVDPPGWALGELVYQTEFSTDEWGHAQLQAALEAGIYEAVLDTRDRFGAPVRARLRVHVVDVRAWHFTTKIPSYLVAPRWEVQAGENFVALWGTGYPSGSALVEIEKRGQRLRHYWTAKGRTQELLQFRVSEKLRGGFTLRITFVRENRAYVEQRYVHVPWSNKRLELRWERFRSKLEPGKKETWTAIVTRHDFKPAVAEVVATLYDASLDAFEHHGWPAWFGSTGGAEGRVRSTFANAVQPFQGIHGSWSRQWLPVELRYRAFEPGFASRLPVHPNRAEVLPLPLESLWEAMARNTGVVEQGGELHVRGGRSNEVSVRISEVLNENAQTELITGGMNAVYGAPSAAHSTSRTDQPDLARVSARRNLEETAFFFPHLMSDAQGVVRLEFTMPEALTEWKFLGFAHDRELRSGFLTGRAVTAKDLMVEPNPPRFVREGDEIEFTAKVTNRSAERRSGKVRLTLSDARTLQPMDAVLGNVAPELDFDVPAQESRSFSWRLVIPDGCEFLIYKAVGATPEQSDGEEGFLPVLSRRILVTESLPMPLRGKQTRHFEFTKLLHSVRSTSLRHQSLTVQMVSQPAWYAVLALPYLMEYPHECSEQIFNRFYANALARHIAASDPRIRRTFELWKDTPALDSPLEKNRDLLAIMLEETPWLRQAQAESQARRNVGLLFDAGRLEGEGQRALARLGELQGSDGLWSWFPGGAPSPTISLYIAAGFGRLRHLGLQVDSKPALRALAGLDAWMDEQFRAIRRHGHEDRNHLNPTIAFYIYSRSFFLPDHPVAAENREALDYWLGQARQFVLEMRNRQSQAHLALGLHRLGETDVPRRILRSLEERSVRDPELGMFWRDLEASWWWYRAPIETQALMVEAFAEVMDDSAAVEDCRVWLLKQKQTQDWKTTKATADAIYALLLRGAPLLASDALVRVALGGEAIVPEAVEAGTGYYEHRYPGGMIRPELGSIVVSKEDEGVSWGSVHWQYLETMSAVSPHEGTALRLRKTLYTKETGKSGPVLRPVAGPVAVGDELVVRIELRVDRDMEYVHLQDQRGCGTEPVDVISRYRFQDGLAYYQSTRDTATHFFIDYLPKGTYVLESSVRIQHRGSYQSGMATAQCMYAPEFNSHSQSHALDVR